MYTRGKKDIIFRKDTLFIEQLYSTECFRAINKEQVYMPNKIKSKKV